MKHKLQLFMYETIDIYPDKVDTDLECDILLVFPERTTPTQAFYSFFRETLESLGDTECVIQIHTTSELIFNSLRLLVLKECFSDYVVTGISLTNTQTDLQMDARGNCKRQPDFLNTYSSIAIDIIQHMMDKPLD